MGKKLGNFLGKSAKFIGPAGLIADQVLKGRSLKKQLEDTIKDRSQYNVADEYFNNQALAKTRAFGMDRDIALAEQGIDRSTSQAIGQAKQISGSTGGLLENLRAITEAGLEQKVGLEQNRAQLKNQRFSDLYNANIAMAEEKDKQWNYNVNEPYQLKVQSLRERRKARQEALFKSLDLAGTLGGAALGGPIGASIGSKLGSAAKTVSGSSDTYSGGWY